jgi:hypothetical protein
MMMMFALIVDDDDVCNYIKGQIDTQGLGFAFRMGHPGAKYKTYVSI